MAKWEDIEDKNTLLCLEKEIQSRRDKNEEKCNGILKNIKNNSKNEIVLISKCNYLHIFKRIYIYIYY